MTPVAAGVGKGSQFRLFIAHQKHAGPSNRYRSLVARLCDVFASTDTDPAGFEEVPLFPCEHVLAYVCLAGEHSALAKWCESELQSSWIQRRRFGSRAYLIDHTVSLRPERISGSASQAEALDPAFHFTLTSPPVHPWTRCGLRLLLPISERQERFIENEGETRCFQYEGKNGTESYRSESSHWR